MPKSKRPRSAKQLANDERLRQQAKERANQAKLANETAQQAAEPEPVTQDQDVSELIKQIKELQDNQEFFKKALLNQQQSSPQTSVQATQGGLVGSFTKYKLDPEHYPDPRARLSQEAKLEQFAFDKNYELRWTVGQSKYKTLDGVNTVEPKFTLALDYILRDEDTGEPTNKRIIMKTLVFHEDPETAVLMARDYGVPIDESNEKAFLDEMRYLRMRDWLIEAFFPKKQSTTSSERREMVFGNKVVPYFEISSESSEVIPFGQLGGKL